MTVFNGDDPACPTEDRAQLASKERLTDGELAKIIQRDAMAGATWFTGPPSFTALAAQDRRALLAQIESLQRELAEASGQIKVLDISNHRLRRKLDKAAHE